MRITKVFVLLLFGTFLLTSCRDTVKEKEVVREVERVEVETEEVPEENEGILERTAKEVDKEVNKEINEEIEKIGDDN